jgi:hypothetical protein
MATSPIATAADYADAMLSARRAKNALFLLILAVIVGQVAIFLVVRHRPSLAGMGSMADTAVAAPATAPSGGTFSVQGLLQWLVAITDFLGIALSMVLAAVLLLLLTIMLVGRLIGVSRVTSAFIWCLVLIVMMFPWQAVLTSPLTVAAEGPPVPDFKLPGVLYTWAELTHPVHGAMFDATAAKRSTFVVLKWARYAAMPGVALVLLLMVQSKSSRGLKMALGEVEFDVARDGS